MRAHVAVVIWLTLLVGCSSAEVAGTTDATVASDSAAADMGPGAIDASRITDAGAPPTDGGGVFVGCRGTGSCTGFSTMACQAAAPFGCAPAQEGRCNIRGCTMLTRPQCGLPDGMGGTTGCIWNATANRCEDDPLCPTQNGRMACTARGCSWVTTAAGCMGTYDCARVPVGDAGPEICGYLGTVGLRCTAELR